MNNLYETGYVPRLAPTRALIHDHPATTAVVQPNVSAERLHRFLLEYTARAVHLTEPVDDWIRRAGRATRSLGHEALGNQLETHAKHEEGHHLMLIQDARALAALWNLRKLGSPVDAEALLSAEKTRAAVAYIDLHETTIASDHPFAQVAIELEIERLSVQFGPPLIERIRSVLGEAFLEKLSFIVEHVEVDAGHTALNEKMMVRWLEDHPETLDMMAAAGRRALEIYLDFFGECLGFADSALAETEPCASSVG